jgi:hypothetical protein
MQWGPKCILHTCTDHIHAHPVLCRGKSPWCALNGRLGGPWESLDALVKGVLSLPDVDTQFLGRPTQPSQYTAALCRLHNAKVVYLKLLWSTVVLYFTGWVAMYDRSLDKTCALLGYTQRLMVIHYRSFGTTYRKVGNELPILAA